MSRNLLRIKAVPGNAGFYMQLITMAIPMIFRCFSISSLTVPKAPNKKINSFFKSCSLEIPHTPVSSLPGFWRFFLVLHFNFLISINSYVNNFSFSFLFINNYNACPLVFYSLICLDFKFIKYFTFLILQHWLWLVWEPFVFRFSYKYLA